MGGFWEKEMWCETCSPCCVPLLQYIRSGREEKPLKDGWVEGSPVCSDEFSLRGADVPYLLPKGGRCMCIRIQICVSKMFVLKYPPVMWLVC